MGPELEGGVLDQLDEGDEQAPGVWSVHNQPLQQHPAIEKLTPNRMVLGKIKTW